MKIGDRVYRNSENNEGTIISIDYVLNYPIHVKWDNYPYSISYFEHELSLVSKPIIDVDILFKEIEI